MNYRDVTSSQFIDERGDSGKDGRRTLEEKRKCLEGDAAERTVTEGGNVTTWERTISITIRGGKIASWGEIGKGRDQRGSASGGW